MIVKTEEQMRTFGSELANQLRPGDWVSINGPLGAGKTVLCAGILHGLGFSGEVASPSYAIVHHYEKPELSIAVVHADLYRLEDVSELDELGLSEDCDDRVTLVEWAERAGDSYCVPTVRVSIEPQSDGSRILNVKMDKHEVKN